MAGGNSDAAQRINREGVEAMTCPHCAKAAASELWHGMQEKCEGCQEREAARSPAGLYDPKYQAERQRYAQIVRAAQRITHSERQP